MSCAMATDCGGEPCGGEDCAMATDCCGEQGGGEDGLFCGLPQATPTVTATPPSTMQRTRSVRSAMLRVDVHTKRPHRCCTGFARSLQNLYIQGGHLQRTTLSTAESPR